MRKTTLVVAATLSGALALAGCGTSAPATPAPTTSASLSGGSTIPASDLATRITDAMVKAGSGRGIIKSEGAKAAQSVSGDLAFVFVGKTTDTQGTIAVAGQTVELVSKGGIVYMKGLPTQLSGGKAWAKIDPNATDDLSKSMKGATGSAGDPRGMVDAFKGGTATLVDRSGGMTHYSINGTKAGGADTKIDLTTDATDLPSNVTTVVAGQTVTTEFRDWGSPVTITVPPANQVGTLR